MRTKMKFISKVTVAHFVTYFICGVLFSKLFNYETLFKLGNAKYFMRDFYGVSSLLGPFVQIIRGLLIGCILLILKDNLLKENRAGLKLWLVFAGLGIICAPSAAPVSIEGIVYEGSTRPMTFHGLWHTYAAETYKKLIDDGMCELDAHFAVSRLLGHEWPDVTNIYLASVKKGGADGK